MQNSFIYRRFVHRILQINDTPESIALGTAVGIWLAMTPTVGIQMILMIIIGTVVRANRLAGIVMVYISNPLTLVPIYWGDYWLGSVLMGQETVTRAAFEEDLNQILRLFNEQGAWDSLRYAIDAKLKIFVPMMVGGSVLGAVLAAPAYPLTLRVVRAHQRRKARKAALHQLREVRRRERAEVEAAAAAAPEPQVTAEPAERPVTAEPERPGAAGRDVEEEAS